MTLESLLPHSDDEGEWGSSDEDEDEQTITGTVFPEQTLDSRSQKFKELTAWAATKAGYLAKD